MSKNYSIERYAAFKSNGNGAVTYQHKAVTCQKTDARIVRLDTGTTVPVWADLNGEGLYDKRKVDKKYRFVRLTSDRYEIAA